MESLLGFVLVVTLIVFIVVGISRSLGGN